MINDQVLGIILGGGQGSRLYPLTKDRSKPAVPIAGKYRLVDIPISNCINSDIKRMYVLTQFNSASLNAHIKNTYHFSFFSAAFVDVLAAEQTMQSNKWFQGTADAVRQSMHHFLANDFEYALILSGDQLYNMDFKDMIQKHKESGAKISIATYPVNAKDATSFGLLKTNSDNTITSFIEKPSSELLPDWTSEVSAEMKSEGRNYLASMGIYIFNRDLLIELMANPDTIDFGKEIIPQAIGEHKTMSYPYEGYWTDIGNIDSFFEANLGLTDDLPKFNLYDENRVYTRARILPTSKFTNTILNKTVIADGCIINAEKIVVTGKKSEQKLYYRHSGRPGGMKIENFKSLQSRIPERILEKSIRGMLPKGILGRKMYKRLKVFKGTEHLHSAQTPELINF